jgi:hypothetical protein
MVAQKGEVGALKSQLITLGISLLFVFLIGLLQNLFLKGECFSFFAISGCDANNLISFTFKLYLTLIFSISFTHFAFVEWRRLYYFIFIVPSLFFGISDSKFAPVILVICASGIILGVIIRMIRLRARA